MEKNFLPGNNYLMNENIAMKYGADLAILLGYLIFADESFNHNNVGQWFSITISELEARIGYKKWKQEQLLNQLEELGAIERKLMGMPAKRYFKIDYERASELASLNEKVEKE